MSYTMCALYTYGAFVFINQSKMLVVGQKSKHVNKILRKTAQALEDIEKGLMSSKIAKNNVPKNTMYTWVKNKDEILSSLEEKQSMKDKIFVVLLIRR